MKRSTWQSPRNILAGFVAGIAVAVLPIDLYILVIPLLVGWLIWTATCGREAAKTQFGIAIAVLVAAWFAPVKPTHMLLRSNITLTQTRFTLAELEARTGRPHRREGLPHAQWRISAKERQAVVNFPREQLTLGEFVDAVESQSSLRHHFISCAHGSTILFGIPPGTLYFRNPNLTWQEELADDNEVAAPPLSSPTAGR